MNPYVQVTAENPNEIHGVRACLGAGQQRGYDCVGPWTTFLQIKVANQLAPFATICAACLRGRAADLDHSEVSSLGYAAPPAESTPEPAPARRQRRSPSKRAPVEDISL